MLKAGDKLCLIKKNGSGSQQQAVTRTKKTGLSPVATKMSIDSVHDHDDNDFASQNKTKDTLTEGW